MVLVNPEGGLIEANERHDETIHGLPGIHLLPTDMEVTVEITRPWGLTSGSTNQLFSMSIFVVPGFNF